MPAPHGVNDQPRSGGEGEDSSSRPLPPSSKSPGGGFPHVSWLSQYYWCLWKNGLLLSRRPFMLCLVLLSGVFSMFVSWRNGRDPGNDAVYPPPEAFTECGTVREEWIDTLSEDAEWRVQYTSNDRWSYGVQVEYMILGGVLHGISAFVVVRSEFKSDLRSMLRTVGLRESVYWVAWYTPFVMISVFSSLLGIMTVKTLPGHVYEDVFLGGIFLSLFLLNLSSIALSFFLAVVCGSGGRLCGLVGCFVMILLAYIPFENTSTSWSGHVTGELFWEYKTTETRLPNHPTNSSCFFPIVNEFQGKWSKTEEERKAVPPNDIFIGW